MTNRKSTKPIDLYSICEISIGYQPNIPVRKRPQISSSLKAHEVFRTNWNDMTIGLYEEFKVMFLNNANRCLGILNIGQGGITSTMVDIRLVYMAALKAAAVSMIVAHNHPSGNLKPSYSDKILTEKLNQASEFLDIKLLDHLILAPDGRYFSFADEYMLKDLDGIEKQDKKKQPKLTLKYR